MISQGNTATGLQLAIGVSLLLAVGMGRRSVASELVCTRLLVVSRPLAFGKACPDDPTVHTAIEVFVSLTEAKSTN